MDGQGTVIGSKTLSMNVPIEVVLVSKLLFVW